MDDSKEPYLILWRGITNAMKKLDELNVAEAKVELMEAQITAEEAYINAGINNNTSLCNFPKHMVYCYRI